MVYGGNLDPSLSCLWACYLAPAPDLLSLLLGNRTRCHNINKTKFIWEVFRIHERLYLSVSLLKLRLIVSAILFPGNLKHELSIVILVLFMDVGILDLTFCSFALRPSACARCLSKSYTIYIYVLIIDKPFDGHVSFVSHNMKSTNY